MARGLATRTRTRLTVTLLEARDCPANGFTVEVLATTAMPGIAGIDDVSINDAGAVAFQGTEDHGNVSLPNVFIAGPAGGLESVLDLSPYGFGESYRHLYLSGFSLTNTGEVMLTRSVEVVPLLETGVHVLPSGAPDLDLTYVESYAARQTGPARVFANADIDRSYAVD